MNILTLGNILRRAEMPPLSQTAGRPGRFRPDRDLAVQPVPRRPKAGFAFMLLSRMAVLAIVTRSFGALVTPAVMDALTPPAPGALHIDGRLGTKLSLSINHRVLAQEIEPLVKPYRVKDEVRADWRGEYWGKWFTSLALADAYQNSPETHAKLKDGYDALVATAASDGYLGTHMPEHRLEGWDIWSRKYALLGVLAYYDRAKDPAALEAATRHMDTLLAETGPEKLNIAEIGDHMGLQSTSVLEPLVLLYRRTGELKYLKFAQYIVGQWSKPRSIMKDADKKYMRLLEDKLGIPFDSWPDCKEGIRLVEDALAGVPPDKMHWTKAYEMMSCFEGLCELYRVTGNENYLKASEKLAANIIGYETTIVGPGTAIEAWSGGQAKQTAAVDRPMETCVTATWMKFCYQLLQLTGKPIYADELEKNLYNGLLGAMMPDGKWWAYFSGINGERVPSDMQHTDVGMSCCVVSGPRALMLTPQWAVMNASSGPVVNLYFPGSAEMATPSGQKVVLTQTTDYPVDDTIEISLNLERSEAFTLALRIPAWSEKSSLSVNGRETAVKPGSYARLQRTWKRGDRVKLVLDLRGRVLEAPDGNGQIAIARGPVVLSLDDRLTPLEPGAVAVVDRKAAAFLSLRPNPAATARVNGWEAFDVPFTVNGKSRWLTMCDYASAGNLWTSQNRFRTWLPQPLNLNEAYESGQVWRKLTHRGFRPVPPVK